MGQTDQIGRDPAPAADRRRQRPFLPGRVLPFPDR